MPVTVTRTNPAAQLRYGDQILQLDGDDRFSGLTVDRLTKPARLADREAGKISIVWRDGARQNTKVAATADVRFTREVATYGDRRKGAEEMLLSHVAQRTKTYGDWDAQKVVTDRLLTNWDRNDRVAYPIETPADLLFRAPWQIEGLFIDAQVAELWQTVATRIVSASKHDDVTSELQAIVKAVEWTIPDAQRIVETFPHSGSDGHRFVEECVWKGAANWLEDLGTDFGNRTGGIWRYYLDAVAEEAAHGPDAPVES